MLTSQTGNSHGSLDVLDQVHCTPYGAPWPGVGVISDAVWFEQLRLLIYWVLLKGEG